MKPVYLDHAATTPIAPEVFAHFRKLLEEGVANSSSSHQEGVRAGALLNDARATVAAKLGCEPGEVIFTSGGTEGNNWILQRVMQDAAKVMKEGKPHLITSSIEHSSIVNVAQWMTSTGLIEWSELPVETDGRVNVETLESMITPQTVLISIGHGNNEIGTIQDLKSIGEVCRRHHVLFHSDACQTFCHEEFSVAELPVDFMSLSGHKIRAPKGVGAIFVRKGIELTPLLFGGKQERGMRPGTTSVELICAFAKAAETWTSADIKKTHAVRSHAVARLKAQFPEVQFNGVEAGKTLCHVLSFTLPMLHSKDIHRELAKADVACSTGAACGTGKSDSSAVLLGLGRAPGSAHQLRISFSPITDVSEVDTFVERLSDSIRALS